MSSSVKMCLSIAIPKPTGKGTTEVLILDGTLSILKKSTERFSPKFSHGIAWIRCCPQTRSGTWRSRKWTKIAGYPLPMPKDYPKAKILRSLGGKKKKKKTSSD